MTRTRLLTATLASLITIAGGGATIATAAPVKKTHHQAHPSKGKKTPGKEAKSSTGPCYSKAEFDAEQALRFHTRLMVIGLTCQQLGGDYVGLYARYKKFTLAHQKQIAGWEHTLIDYYRHHAKGNGLRDFDTLRTHLANEMSQHIAAVSTDIYCAMNAPSLAVAEGMSDADVTREATSDAVVRVSELPRCDLPRPTVVAAIAGDRVVGVATATAFPVSPAQVKTPSGGQAGGAAP